MSLRDTKYKPAACDLQRFWAKVEIRNPNQCWNWKATKHYKGYGEMKWYKGSVIKDKAHRISWMIHNGPIPNNYHVLHKCDNPACVNPHHLFLGTNADNVKDRDRKGRHTAAKGEDQGNSKLTWKQVREIRRRYATGSITQTRLGKEYGVRQTTISQIVTGTHWKE